MTGDDRTDWEAIARALEETGEYRIIRRFRPGTQYAEPDGQPSATAIILDTETTGIDTQKDEIIELGMLLFEYAPATGRIYRIVDTFEQLRDPGRPIPPEITRMTRITDEMVHGQVINPAAVDAFVARGTFVISHNASFDRPFVERQWKVFETKPWACSMSQIPWYDEGIATQKQELIALCTGFFYEPHRAVNDCRALLNILAAKLPVSGAPALKGLLDRASQDDAVIWALGAPFEQKDTLKAHGYHFNNGANGNPRAWRKTVAADEVEQELCFLDSVYEGGNARTKVRIDEMSPLDRFSGRA